MNNEKKVFETVEPEQEAAAQTSATEKAKAAGYYFDGRTKLREMVRLKAMRYGERAEWYRDMGYDRLAEQEIERKRFLFDVIEGIDKCPTFQAAYQFLTTESMSMFDEHRWAKSWGLVKYPSEFDLWKIKFLHRLTNRLDFGDVEDQEMAWIEYLEAVADEGGFWL